MRLALLIRAVTPLVLLFMFSAGENAWAQARKAGAAAAQPAGKDGIQVRKVELSKARSPDYSTSANEAALNPGEWTRVLVKFDTEADWTDQLELRFFIVLKHPRTSAYTMFTGAFTYTEIPKGRNRQAAVFLRPRTTERYGAAEQAAVEVHARGELVSAGSFPESAKPWWRSATVRSVEGYVLERSQTPFAYIAADNYETPKGK